MYLFVYFYHSFLYFFTHFFLTFIHNLLMFYFFIFSHTQSSGRHTAVKIINKKKLSEEDLAALMSEISILTELNHPHIIK